MVEKEMSSHNHYRETFWEIAFWCVTSSHRVPPFPSWNSLLTLLSWILQTYIWELIEGYGEKVNILRSNLERSFLRNCIAMSECNSQSYTFLFSGQSANYVFWKSAMEYRLSQWSLRWQRKYPSWWCVISSHRVTLMYRGAVHFNCLSETWEGLICIALKSTLIKEISSVPNVKEAFWETSFWSVSLSHRLIT